MPDASILIAFLVMHWLVTMSPGPNTVLVTQTALARGRAHAFAVIAGICAAAVVWVCAAALGLKLVFTAAPWLGSLLMVLGAGYLITLGIGMIRATPRRPTGDENPDPPCPSLRRSFGHGILVNITNPKTLAYFSSIFATALPQEVGGGAILALIAIAWICNLGWYGGLTLLLDSAAVRRLHAGGSAAIDRTAGFVMIAFGLGMALERP